MDKRYLVSIFERANRNMLRKDKSLLESEVSEPCICGALKSHLEEKTRGEQFRNYYVDVEYNRQKGGKVKTILIREDGNTEERIVAITPDLIIHSRGEMEQQDNLMVLEMKKSTRKQEEKDEDRLRLITMTKRGYKDGVYGWDGTDAEHVCNYILGVYYEINFSQKRAHLEYYALGRKFDSKYVRLDK